MADFTHVKVGDTVTRMLSGTIPMQLRVTKVDDDLIHCGSEDFAVQGWTFDRQTGAEVDEDLKWGPKYGYTGSYLVP